MMFHEALQLIKTDKAAYMYRASSSAKYSYDKDNKTYLHLDKKTDQVMKHHQNLRVYISPRYRTQAEIWCVQLPDGSERK